MVQQRRVRRCPTRLLVQGIHVVPRSSTAAPRSVRHRPVRHRSVRHRSVRTRPVRTSLLVLLGVLAAVVLPALPAQAAPPIVTPGAAIEALAPYQGQQTCAPVARPGAIALRDLVLRNYPGTGDSGIVRGCSVGGSSEHKEGRAWDWRVNTSNPTQVLQVDDLMAWLLAPDEHGTSAAMARRLGIMYMIWDSKVWKSYQASKGWQRYVGASPHTDHVHFSLSWAGAYAQTSYWTGTVAPTMYAPAPPVLPVPSAPPALPAPPAAGTATPTVGAATPTVGMTPPAEAAPEVPAPAVVDRRLQRRLVMGSMPGPWRRR